MPVAQWGSVREPPSQWRACPELSPQTPGHQETVPNSWWERERGFQPPVG